MHANAGVYEAQPVRLAAVCRTEAIPVRKEPEPLVRSGDECHGHVAFLLVPVEGQSDEWIYHPV
jgi:hypothetical protein